MSVISFQFKKKKGGGGALGVHSGTLEPLYLAVIGERTGSSVEGRCLYTSLCTTATVSLFYVLKTGGEVTVAYM